MAHFPRLSLSLSLSLGMKTAVGASSLHGPNRSGV